MKQLRLLTVIFDTPLNANDLSAFRGAIASKVGLEHEWFHNHNNQKDNTSNYHYRYPLIQYKRHRGKPMIVCIEQGVEEIHKFFSKPNWDLTLNGAAYKIKIYKLGIEEYHLQVREKPYRYQIRNWIALNQQKYKAYQKCNGLIEKIQFLENLLAANLIAFAKGVNWQMERRFEVKITEMKDKAVIFKNNKVMAFDVVFQTGVFLPNYIGLGKGCTLGFGKLVQKIGRKHKQRAETNEE